MNYIKKLMLIGTVSMLTNFLQAMDIYNLQKFVNNNKFNGKNADTITEYFTQSNTITQKQNNIPKKNTFPEPLENKTQSKNSNQLDDFDDSSETQFELEIPNNKINKSTHNNDNN